MEDFKEAFGPLVKGFFFMIAMFVAGFVAINLLWLTVGRPTAIEIQERHPPLWGSYDEPDRFIFDSLFESEVEEAPPVIPHPPKENFVPGDLSKP